MKPKKFTFIIGVALISTLLTIPKGWTQPLKKGPMITRSYAEDKGYYGTIWKIYIEAEDSDGEMSKIACVVDQVGYGHYPTDWTYLKPEYRHHLKGYLQWNTFSSTAPYLSEWTSITLKVSIFDKAGNESNEVVFPFTFESGVWPPLSLPPPFDQGDLPRLGYIDINLINPYLGGRERWWEDRF